MDVEEGNRSAEVRNFVGVAKSEAAASKEKGMGLRCFLFVYCIIALVVVIGSFRAIVLSRFGGKGECVTWERKMIEYDAFEGIKMKCFGKSILFLFVSVA